MDTQALISHARQTRDDSLSAIQPPLPKPPSPLPKNVTKIPDQVLSKEELEITNHDPVSLLAAIREKRYTCVAVTKAFLRRAALAQELTNCITELLPSLALSRASYLDTLAVPLGPLHGLPISIKEHHGMLHRPTNGSYVAWIQTPADPCGDRYSVNDVLSEAGCVFYARTTQPQAIMQLETETVIYGRTTNPYNTDLTAGGSSGGEGALVGLRGSVLGIGGDIGGSIRSPAANCGIYGFKPTPLRLGKTGSRTVEGVYQEGIISTEGPLSVSASGLSLFMKTYLDSEPWIRDNYLVPLPWRAVSLPPPTGLRIAVMWDDGVVRPHPPITRALKEVVEVLRSKGVRISAWVPEGHDESWDLTQALYYEDGGRALEKLIQDGGEEMLPLTAWLVRDEKNVRYRSVEEVWDLKLRRNRHRMMYNEKWLDTAREGDGGPIDAILCPAGPGAAPRHGDAKYWSYTSQWNLLEYPAVVFPVTVVDQTLDRPGEEWRSYKPRNESDRFNHEMYEVERYKDAPVGLQVVTRRWEDEKCLAVLEAIEKAMGRK